MGTTLPKPRLSRVRQTTITMPNKVTKIIRLHAGPERRIRKVQLKTNARVRIVEPVGKISVRIVIVRTFECRTFQGDHVEPFDVLLAERPTEASDRVAGLIRRSAPHEWNHIVLDAIARRASEACVRSAKGRENWTKTNVSMRRARKVFAFRSSLLLTTNLTRLGPCFCRISWPYPQGRNATIADLLA